MSAILSPFKSVNNQWFTASLFAENKFRMPADQRETWEPKFCLYGELEGVISCQKTFLAVDDPTGLRWAEQYIGGYEHLQMLLKASWFREAFESWQDELRLKTETNALNIIKEIAKETGNKARFQAAKFLVDHSKRKTVIKRGRPSEEEVTGELKKEVEARKSAISDAERIGLRVIEGGKNG